MKKTIFVHSLFRSSSTYFYSVLKSTGCCQVYHEPFHEVVSELTDKKEEILARTNEIKKSLRHGFLEGNYFEEYETLLPDIKDVFNREFGFGQYFMDESSRSEDMISYIDVLVNASESQPVLQCVRSIGKINWLKGNYDSSHIFLLRNPWDQWFSYKVDKYIYSTTRLIYSQSNIPKVLIDVASLYNYNRVCGADTKSKLNFIFDHPVSPDVEYCLFFGMWVYASLVAYIECDVVINMDSLSTRKSLDSEAEFVLSRMGIVDLDFSACKLHRTFFSLEEKEYYKRIEDEVLKVFDLYYPQSKGVLWVREYLVNERCHSFKNNLSVENTGNVVDDVCRLRLLLRNAESFVAEVRARVDIEARHEREIIVRQYDEVTRERDEALKDVMMLKNFKAALYNSAYWKVTKPVRVLIDMLKNVRQRYKQYLHRTLKYVYYRMPVSYATKHRLKNWLFLHLPKFIWKHFPEQYHGKFGHGKVLKNRQNLIGDIDIGRPFILPVSEIPKVSIIIPVYGEVEYTYKCLLSIANCDIKCSYEIIVVDDFSLDNTRQMIEKIGGVRLVSNRANMGFIRSCNVGANEARGEYVLFLNNDTQVLPGWLDYLVATFDMNPNTGLAGSKLIYPDGRLQEAGGIIWRDGSAWNFGRLDDAGKPEYNYMRDADYISGASIMVPLKLFNELNGFDEYYLPAYCEDSDLALRISDKGYRVLYQPLSTVVHFEGVTSGTDPTQGVKSYQQDNTVKLFERWRKRLEVYPLTGTDVGAAKDRCANFRVLVIDHCVPMPDQDAGSVTVFNTMLLLKSMGFQVTFIAEDNLLYSEKYTPALQMAGIEAIYKPYCTSVEQHLKALGQRYDLAFLFRPIVVERHLELIRQYCPKAKILFHTVDLHFLRMSREAEIASDGAIKKASEEMKQIELSAIRKSDATIVHSTAELDVLEPLLPDARLHVFPLIMDVPGTYIAFKQREGIVFVGGYQHAPNVDAVKYFVLEIMPLIRIRLPGVRFYAVGSQPPAEILSLASEDVIIRGFVEDLDSELGQRRVSIAPLRYGAGIKGKIGTAMAAGLPVVATPLAVEGMQLADGENIIVADAAEAFADAVLAVYEDEKLWQRISDAGVQFAENAWGAEAAWRILGDILEGIGIHVLRDGEPLQMFSKQYLDLSNSTISMQKLVPLAAVKSRGEFEAIVECDTLQKMRSYEEELVNEQKNDAYSVLGYCVPCRMTVPFLVDKLSGAQKIASGWLPNWRERLECPNCKMNNRQRLIATLIEQELSSNESKLVYFMEQVTPIYSWAVDKFKRHEIMGSEYLGYEYEGGSVINGIRHEDIENLSFGSGSLDLIVSNDVFEHVPNPKQAFSECSRVLKDGGIMLASIPFQRGCDESVSRAKIVDGKLEEILPSAYHGNPVSDEGSLVFTDFGWDMLKDISDVGFSEVSAEVYASKIYGHLGGGQLIFRLKK